MQKKAINNLLIHKEALEIISKVGIPKEKRHIVLDIMSEKKLIEKVNKQKIRIINLEKSKDINFKIYAVLWEEYLK